MVVRAFMPSNAFNAINFLLFDLLFAFLIQYFTATIAGLFNCLSVNSFCSEDVKLRNIPFVGPGITCMKPRVFISLSVIRLLSWIFVFVTTFFSTGSLYEEIHRVPAEVLTIGKIGLNPLSRVLIDKSIKRRGCQGRESKFTYYGEIRNSKCELDRELLDSPIEFEFAYKPTNIMLDGCVKKEKFIAVHDCKKNKLGVLDIICRRYANKSNVEECTTSGYLPLSECTKIKMKSKTNSFSCLINNERQILNGCPQLDFEWHHENYRCKNAVIGCYYLSGRVLPVCYATVKMPNLVYVCENLNRSTTPQQAMCKVVRRIKWDADEWLDQIGSYAMPSIEEAISILYASGTERREVKVRKKGRLVTEIQPLWFAILSLKVLIVVFLAAVVIYLRFRMRLEPLANNEQGMKKLLTMPKLRNPYGSLNSIEGSRETEVHVFWDGTAIKMRTADD